MSATSKSAAVSFAEDARVPETCADDDRWRGFVKRFLVLLAALLSITVVLNFTVNPIAWYPTHLLEPVIWNPREFKVRLLQSANPKPEALILGSSRSWSFSPKELEQITGLRSFNFGVDTARAEDYQVLLRYAVERAAVKPKLVVIGADVEAFHNSNPVDSRLEQIWAFHGLIPHNERSWIRLGVKISGLFALQQTELSMRSLRFEYANRTGIGPRREATYNVDIDGQTGFPKYEAQRAAGSYDLDQKIQEDINVYRERWNGFTHLSPVRVRELEETIQYCRDRNIRVVLYLTPLHPRLQAALLTENFESRRGDVVAMLQRLSRSSGVLFLDLSDLKTFGGEPDEFWDGAHMTPVNGTRLVKHVMVRGGYAVQ